MTFSEYHTVHDEHREHEPQPPHAGFVVKVECKRPQARLESSICEVFREEVEYDAQPDGPSFSLGSQLRTSGRSDGVSSRDEAEIALS